LNNNKKTSHYNISLKELSNAKVMKFNLGFILKAYQIFPDIKNKVNNSIIIMA